MRHWTDRAAANQVSRPPGLVIEFAIRWCRKELGSRHPHFRFVHADVYNKHYNRRGNISPTQYSFPLSPGSITFCLATSVFTHLLPETTERYVAEIARVLHQGGRFLSSWFLLNETTESCVAEGKAQFDFKYRFANHARVSVSAPEAAVAYRLDYLKTIGKIFSSAARQTNPPTFRDFAYAPNVNQPVA
jgi:SAM-dependent methyltransferase